MSKKELKWQTEHRMMFQQSYQAMVSLRDDVWSLTQPAGLPAAQCDDWLRAATD
jgi:hypothetical protein